MKSKTEVFIDKVKNIENYSFDKVHYVNAKTKVIITCNTHGDFEITPNNFLSGQRCKLCSEAKRAKSFSERYRQVKYEGLIQPEDYKLIPLDKRGRVTKVDNELFEQLKVINWYFDGRYVSGVVQGKKVRLHNYIMSTKTKQVVDHINQNSLDNRLSNLRVCSHKENIRNSKAIKGSSKFKGVCYFKRTSKWTVNIECDGVTVNLGYFIDEIEAAKAYDKKALELFGEFAYLNFPELRDEYEG